MKDKSFRKISLMSLILCTFIVATSCSSDHSTDQIVTSPQATDQIAKTRQVAIDKLGSLARGMPPEQLTKDIIVKTGNEFDANEYFSVLNHLSMESGYVLDYVYHKYDNAGKPYLYARKMEDRPYLNYDDFYNSVKSREDWVFGYLDHVQIDDTEEGFFQFMVLRTTGNQFYICWHAAYDSESIICDATRLDHLELPSDLKTKAEHLDFAPKVDIQESVVILTVVVFNRWKGFSEITCTVNRAFPHSTLNSTRQTLLPCNLGPVL